VSSFVPIRQEMESLATVRGWWSVATRRSTLECAGGARLVELLKQGGVDASRMGIDESEGVDEYRTVLAEQQRQRQRMLRAMSSLGRGVVFFLLFAWFFLGVAAYRTWQKNPHSPGLWFMAGVGVAALGVVIFGMVAGARHVRRIRSMSVEELLEFAERSNSDS